MTKYLIILTIVLFSIVGCRNDSKFEYDYNRLIKAWEVGDSLYLKNWILNLDHSDFVTFSNRVSEYANETNFCYGNIDIEGDIKSRWTPKEQEIIQNNVKVVYETYLKSCIFLNKDINYDGIVKIANKYWNDSTLLTKNDIHNLKIDFQNICKTN